MQEINEKESKNALIPLQPTSGAGSLVKATEVISAMMTRGLTARQVADEFEIPFLEVVELLGNPIYLRHFSQIRKEAAKAEFHAVVHDEMASVVRNGKPMEKVAAANTWAGILGEKSGGTVQHEHSWIDDTIKNLKANGRVIDVKVIEENDDEL